MNSRLLIVILVIGTFCGGVNAQIITDRPDQTESSSTVPRGGLQVESGLLLGYEGEYKERIRQVLLPTSLFRYGLTNCVELRITNQFEMLKIGEKRLDGLSDMEIGAKVQLLKGEGRKTEMAFLSHLIVPTGTDNLTSGKYGSSSKISISHGLNEDVGIGYNLGYNYFGKGNGDFVYSLALGIGVNDKVGIYIEPYGEVVNLDDFIANFNTGFTYLANENLQFDFSFGTGINQPMNYIAIGCSWLIEEG